VAEGGGEGQVTAARSGMPDVFLSYASQDGAVAEAVCEALEQAGVRCWIAPRDVTPGTFYADEIVHAIDAAKAIVLILSQNAAASPHVLREVERATSKRRPVVSLRIDRASLPAGLEYFLNTSQWLDASGGDPIRAMPKLVAALRLAIGRPAATNAAIVATPAAVQASGASHPGSDGSRRRIAIVAASLLAVAIGGFAIYRSRLPEQRLVAPPAVAAAGGASAAAPPASSIPEQSVAVLPFVDMSEKKDQEYFSDGLSEELIDMLTKVPDLRVPARTSSFYFKGKPTKIPDIAKELGVAHVLEGSVRKSGNRLRVTAQLVRADNGYHLWSETYDRKLDDIFEVQDDIADAVVKALKVSLLAAPGRAPATKNMEAYTLMLKAHYFLTMSGTQDDVEKAIDYYQQAVRLDPTSAPAWAGLSRALAELTFTQSWKQVRQRAIDAAHRALELDPGLADAHVALGKIHFYDWEWENAEAQFKQARELEPTNSSAFWLSGRLASALGHAAQALQYYQEASALDPLYWAPYFDSGSIYEFRSQFAEAEAAFRKAEGLAPTLGFTGEIGFMQLREGGDSAAALAEISRTGNEANRAYYLAASYAILGRRADADAALALFQKDHATDSPYSMACLYAWRAESNNTFDWLDRAYQQHEDQLYWIKVEPAFDRVKSEPRYKAFLRRMNLPE
jgi:TolB-like protein/Tfp pilus assembly protein PilF